MKIPLKEIRLDSGTIVCGGLTKGVSCKAEGDLLLTYDSELEVVVCERHGVDTELLPVHFVVKMTPQVWPVGAKAIASNSVDEKPIAGKLDQLRDAAIAIVEGDEATDAHTIERYLDDGLRSACGVPVDETSKAIDAIGMQEAKERARNEPVKEPIVVDESVVADRASVAEETESSATEKPPTEQACGGVADSRAVLAGGGLPIAERAWTGDYRDSGGKIIDSSATDYSQPAPDPAPPQEADGDEGVVAVLDNRFADLPEAPAEIVPAPKKPKRKKGRK